MTSLFGIRIARDHFASLNVVFGVGIFTKERIQCYGTNTYIDRIKIEQLPRSGKVRFIIHNLDMIGGSYSLDVAVHSEEGIPYDYQTDRYYFNVLSDKQDVGIYRPNHEWCFIEG